MTTSPAIGNFYAQRTARLVERLVKKRLAPGEDTAASVCIGGPANFEHKTFRSTTTVTWPSGTPEDQPEGGEIYEAIWWELETVRVENPTDSEQYVNTTRALQVRYRRPDGSEVQLNNKPMFADFPAT